MIAMLEMVVAVAAAYWGWFYLSRGRRAYGGLVILAGVIATFGTLGPRAGMAARDAGLVGGLGALAAVLMLVVGPACRAAARAVVQADRLRLAGALLEIADVLMPFAGVGDDKLALAALREVRAGRIDDTVAALQQGKARLPPALGRAIDERITMLYLSAHRWKEAVDHADRTLAPKPPASGEPEPPDAWAAARTALGMSPPLWVEVLGAVAREGDLERAGAMLQELEAVCGEREDAFWLRHRGRLVFLAFAGRTAAVERLVAPDVARHMSRSARSYWRGVAAASAGDSAAAQGAYTEALARSRGRARALVERALDDLARPRTAEPSAHVRQVAEEIEALPLHRPEPVARRRRSATLILVALNLAVAAAVTLAFGSTSDPAVVVRAGGALRGAIAHGEWWRLVSTVAIHIGVAHLVLNVLGLLAVGRWAETVFGARVVAALYVTGGLGGAGASYLAGTAPLSAGASGAIFGLVGALIVELGLHRRAYRSVWRSGLLGALLVALAAQLALGYTFPQDQWAHAGGLTTGAFLALALSPHRRARRAVTAVATGLAGLGAALAVVAGVQVARTDYGDTLARLPRATRVVDGLALTAPAAWEASGTTLADRDLFVAVRVERGDPAAWLAGEGVRARDDVGLTTVRPAAHPRLRPPAGWTAAELEASVSDEYVTQRYRVVALGRPDGVVASVYVPESLAADAWDQLAAMVASITDRGRPTAPP